MWYSEEVILKCINRTRMQREGWDGGQRGEKGVEKRKNLSVVIFIRNLQQKHLFSFLDSEKSKKKKKGSISPLNVSVIFIFTFYSFDFVSTSFSFSKF